MNQLYLTVVTVDYSRTFDPGYQQQNQQQQHQQPIEHKDHNPLHTYKQELTKSQETTWLKWSDMKMLPVFVAFSWTELLSKDPTWWYWSSIAERNQLMQMCAWVLKAQLPGFSLETWSDYKRITKWFLFVLRPRIMLTINGSINRRWSFNSLKANTFKGVQLKFELL